LISAADGRHRLAWRNGCLGQPLKGAESALARMHDSQKHDDDSSNRHLASVLCFREGLAENRYTFFGIRL